MAKMNLATPENTLKTALADYASKYWFRRLLVAQLEDKLSALRASRAGMDKVDGTAVAFSDEEKERVDTAIRDTEAELAGVNAIPECKYTFTETDKVLRKEWKVATTPGMRINAIKAWLHAYGLDCDDSQAGDIARKMGMYNIKAVKDEKIVLDGATYTEDKRTINLGLLYKYMIDLHLEKGAFSPKLIPDELKEIWQARRDAVKAQKEAKKANK